MESVLLFVKIFGGIATALLLGGLKYLHSILQNSKDTKTEFHDFKNAFNLEITNLKNKMELFESKIKDSYSKPESDNRLLTLENKLMKEMTDQFNKLRDLIYSTLNRNRQTSKPDKPS